MPKKKDTHLTATLLVNQILDRPLIWVDRSKMTDEVRQVWATEAQSLLRNRVFIALCGKTIDGEKTNGELVKIMIEHIARYSSSHEETRDMRMQMSGIELIREHAESFLLPPEIQPSMDHLNDPI